MQNSVCGCQVVSNSCVLGCTLFLRFCAFCVNRECTHCVCVCARRCAWVFSGVLRQLSTSRLLLLLFLFAHRISLQLVCGADFIIWLVCIFNINRICLSLATVLLLSALCGRVSRYLSIVSLKKVTAVTLNTICCCPAASTASFVTIYNLKSNMSY